MKKMRNKMMGSSPNSSFPSMHEKWGVQIKRKVFLLGLPQDPMTGHVAFLFRAH